MVDKGRRTPAPASSRGELRPFLFSAFGALLLASPLIGCSAQRATPTPGWNADQRSIYVYACMNGDVASDYGPAAKERYCSCYQAEVEKLHPYSWVVDGRPPTPVESDEIMHVEGRCMEGVLARYSTG
jgi:hypothetical protein